MRQACVVLLLITLLGGLFGCATPYQEQGAVVGTAAGAGLGALIGGLAGGRDGALIGAVAGAAIGGLTGWAIAKQREAVAQAAYRNQMITYMNQNRTERVVAEPVESRVITQPTQVQETVLVEQGGSPSVQNRSRTLNPGTYRKVRSRTYKVDSKTNQEVVTSDTNEWVPVD
jgi:hypothetical protein